MSFHLFTYTGLVTAGTNAKVPAVQDPAMTTINSNYLLPTDYRAKFAFAMSPTMTAARITSPSIGANYSPQIRPINTAATIPNDPPFCSFLESPLLLPQREGIEMDISNTLGTPEQIYGCIGASSVDVPAARGEVKAIRATSTTPAVANVYTTLNLLFDSSLQRGIYDVVGCDVVSATGIFFRLIFTAQVERPGGICSNALGNRPNQYWNQRFIFGSYGAFQETQLPQLEIMCSGTTAVHTAWIYLVKKS